jgi:Fe-Mn family superoxide dismutase
MADLFVAKPLKPKLFELDGISKKTMEEHYKLYEGYVKKANEIWEKLAAMDPDPATANPTYSEIRELKVEFSRAVGGVKNHNAYFAHLGGKGGQPSGALLKHIEKDFGSFDRFARDLKATGIAARGWAWLALDFQTGKLVNFIGDEQNTYPIWNATPLVALDVFEHAYYLDYGTKKGDYIDAFMKNLDWGVVEKWYNEWQWEDNPKAIK